LSGINEDGVLGKWPFTDAGDMTLTTMSVRQVRNGAWDNATIQGIEARALDGGSALL